MHISVIAMKLHTVKHLTINFKVILVNFKGIFSNLFARYKIIVDRLLPETAGINSNKQPMYSPNSEFAVTHYLVNALVACEFIPAVSGSKRSTTIL